jgi:hypothetical protein
MTERSIHPKRGFPVFKEIPPRLGVQTAANEAISIRSVFQSLLAIARTEYESIVGSIVHLISTADKIPFLNLFECNSGCECRTHLIAE